MRLSRLFIYPIKSARGIEVTRATVLERGLEFDRRFMVVDAEGMAITARRSARLLRVHTAIRGQTLEIGYPGLSALHVPLEPDAQDLAARTVRVWADEMPGVDLGDEAQHWFSALLEMPASLVWMPPHSPRRMNPALGPSRLSFADGNPLHLVNEASVHDLETRTGQPIELERFRPNLVAADAKPYEEDAWTDIQVGALTLRNHEPCARCMMVNLEPNSAELSLEPLRSLAQYRRVGKLVNFGIHLHALSVGELEVGALVKPVRDAVGF
jgi:uncharacterized protein YcbX